MKDKFMCPLSGLQEWCSENCALILRGKDGKLACSLAVSAVGEADGRYYYIVNKIELED
jgi:hypothetical protein